MSWRKYQGVHCYKCGGEAPRCRCRPLSFTWAGYPMQLQESWAAKYERPPKYFSKKERRQAMSYYRAGYRQVSRRYRHIQSHDMVTNAHGAQYIGKVGESIEVSEQVLRCMRRIDNIVSYYKYYIPYREERKVKEAKRQAKFKRIMGFSMEFVYGVVDHNEKVLSKMTFDRELSKEERSNLFKWARDVFGKQVVLLRVT